MFWKPCHYISIWVLLLEETLLPSLNPEPGSFVSDIGPSPSTPINPWEIKFLQLSCILKFTGGRWKHEKGHGQLDFIWFHHIWITLDNYLKLNLIGGDSAVDFALIPLLVYLATLDYHCCAKMRQEWIRLSLAEWIWVCLSPRSKAGRPTQGCLGETREK